MPQYYSHLNQGKVGNIKVTPLSLWRRIFRWWPYFVGDRVRFELEVVNPPDHPYTLWRVFERFGNQAGIIQTVKKGKQQVIGGIINSEGDIEYSIGSLHSVPGTDRFTVFTAQVINKDRWVLGCVGVVIGAIVTIATGIGLGFIDVVEFWKIWIP